MGIAKQRGSYAERVVSAQERNEQLNVKRQENLAALNEMEAKTSAQNTKVIEYFVAEQIKEYDNNHDAAFQAVWRADMSIPAKQGLLNVAM